MKWKGVYYRIHQYMRKYKTYKKVFIVIPHVCEYCHIVCWLENVYKKVYSCDGSLYARRTYYCCSNCYIEDNN